VTTRILAACSPGEVRVAAERDGVLVDYAIWRPGAPDGVGDLYRGRVIARVPAMAGAFVALDGAEGFLPDSQGPDSHRADSQGADAVSAGSMLAVRVTRAAQGGKGPRLTARLAADEQALAGSGTPALLRRGPGAIERLAALHPDAAVLLDDAGVAAALRPVLGERVAVVRTAFDDELAGRIDALAEPSVALPGGAVLQIYPTPALVAIDMDAGAASGQRRGKWASQLAMNRAALPALGLEIRLRNLSGAILVDLAGLPARRRSELGPDLAAALADDPVGPRLLGFTQLGLAEIVRPRVHPPLHEMLAGPHAAGLAALRRIATEVAAAPHRTLRLRAGPAVVAALQADPVALPELAGRTGRALILRADPALPDISWTIEDADD
jgi:Ribonuclease G/E